MTPNDNNRLLRAGAVKLGFAHVSPLHNRIGCSGCGHCILGCAYNRKHHAVFAFLEDAVARGLRIATNARASRVVRRGDAWEVRGPGFTARARTVVLAASALATPVLLQQSGLGGAAVGRTLRLHPFAPVAALFDHVIDAHRGVPQSTLITAGSRFLTGARGGFLLMASPAGPAATAAFMPGHGAPVAELMRRWRHLAVAGVLLHDEHPARVRARSDGRPSIDAWPAGDDIAQIRAGVEQLAHLWFAAGATEVLLPFARRPRITSVAELDGLDRLPFRKWDVLLNSVHPHGSVPIGRADAAPLTPEGAVRGAPGVFVADGSALPTSVGVPPQVTISAFALCIAHGITSEARSRA